jgi:general stress protein 26
MAIHERTRAMAQTEATTERRTPAKKPPAKSAAAKSATAKSSATKTAAKPATARKPASAKAAATARAKPTKSEAAKPVPTAKIRDTSATAKEHAEHVERIWELAKRIGVCMFVTWDGERQRARPLAATVEKKERALYFLTDIDGQKDDQIEKFPTVTLAFADHSHSKYVSITGTATVSNDRQRIKDLWSPFAKAWWDGPEDPAIRVIKVVPQDAELWDSPGRIVTTISMLAAAVTGRPPRIGENAKVAL